MPISKRERGDNIGHIVVHRRRLMCLFTRYCKGTSSVPSPVLSAGVQQFIEPIPASLRARISPPRSLPSPLHGAAASRFPNKHMLSKHLIPNVTKALENGVGKGTGSSGARKV